MAIEIRPLRRNGVYLAFCGNSASVQNHAHSLRRASLDWILAEIPRRLFYYGLIDFLGHFCYSLGGKEQDTK